MAAGHSQGTENRISRWMGGAFPDLLSLENARVTQPLNLAWVREARNVLLGAAGILLSYKYAVSGNAALLSALWLPDSVLLCCLLFAPVSRWWIYLLFALPVRMHYGSLNGLPEWQLLANYPNDIVKALLSAALLRVFSRGRFRLDTLYQFRLFFIVAVVLSPALSAIAGAVIRHTQGEPFWQVWYRWYLSCALAALSITPSLINWITSPPQALRTTTRRYVEAFLLSC